MALLPESGGIFSNALGRIRGVADRVLSNDLPGAVNEAMKGSITGKSKTRRSREAGPILGKQIDSQIFDNALPGANKYLLAKLFRCNKEGGALTDEQYPVITAPAFDVNLDVTLNWHSQFESMNMDNFKPSLMAMIQSGEIGTAVQGLQALAPDLAAGVLGQGVKFLTDVSSQLEGKTGITKLNSRQVFAGMPPIKITLSLVFRAFSDAVTEVQIPSNQILQWALPEKLANDGISGRTEADNVISALFPSDAPGFVGLIYGRNRYAPLVIESCPIQLDGPMTSDGVPVYRVIQLTLSTLTALDRHDLAERILGFNQV